MEEVVVCNQATSEVMHPWYLHLSMGAWILHMAQ